MARGRKPKFTEAQSKKVAAVIRKHGLTYGQKFLATTGIQLVNGKPRTKISVSLPTLGKVAVAHKIELFRGRPAA